MKLKFCALSILLLAGSLTSQAAEKKPAKSFDVRSVAYLTCGEAWEEAGKSDDKILAMVKSMAGYSLSKRHLTFPNTKEDGAAVGNMIKERCVAAPDESLLSIVDRSIRDHLKKQG